MLRVLACLLAIVTLNLSAPILALPARAEVSISIVTLPSRPEAMQSFVLMLPDQPVATAILFAGSNGRVPLGRLARREPTASGNFLLRIQNMLVERGLALAIADAPSDRQTQEGLNRYFRASPEHALDIDAVVAYLQRIVAKPVWLVGTSSGTESAAAVATVLSGRISGVVLTSSMSMSTPNGPSMFELPIERIRVPVLVMAHKDDACRFTPPYLAEKIVERLAGAPRRQLVMVEGGLPARSDPCEPMSAHGYYGVEQQAADAIATFIKAP